jgi:hypothetical protein
VKGGQHPAEQRSNLVLGAQGIMQHEADAEVNCAEDVAPPTQGWNTHRATEVHIGDLKQSNISVRKSTMNIADLRLTHSASLTKSQLLV